MSEESRIGDHFDAVASIYDKYREIDLEPVNWLAANLPVCKHAVCDLGCGTARYAFALMERLKELGCPMTRLIGVDPSAEMLKEASTQSTHFDFACEWVHASSDATGLPPDSITVVTSFNSIHYLPVAETLAETHRICRKDGYLAIYTRLKEQEEEHIWGRWFPGFLERSFVPSRDYMETLSSVDPRFVLEDSREFRLPREATFSWVCEQTSNKFYSTFNHYAQEDFEQAYTAFVNNLKANYKDLNRIHYWSSNSLWLYRIKES